MIVSGSPPCNSSSLPGYTGHIVGYRKMSINEILDGMQKYSVLLFTGVVVGLIMANACP
jgi:hypothetical protein